MTPLTARTRQRHRFEATRTEYPKGPLTGPFVFNINGSLRLIYIRVYTR